MYCIRKHILTAKTLGIFQWCWWFSFKVLTLSCKEKLFALWARRFWIYDSVCTVPICCNHILTAKKLGIFQWLWWFSFKGLTLSCEEKLFALWARRFWIYDYVCTVPICCNHILTAKKLGIFQWFWWFSFKVLTLSHIVTAKTLRISNDFGDFLWKVWRSVAKKTCLRCDLTYFEFMILFALLQPYSNCKNAWHVHWFWRISWKGLTCGCEEPLLALWFSTCLIYDSGCIAATTPCNHILTAKKLFANGFDDFLTKIEVWLSRHVKKSPSMWWPLGCNPLIMELFR